MLCLKANLIAKTSWMCLKMLDNQTLEFEGETTYVGCMKKYSSVFIIRVTGDSWWPTHPFLDCLVKHKALPLAVEVGRGQHPLGGHRHLLVIHFLCACFIFIQRVNMQLYP